MNWPQAFTYLVDHLPAIIAAIFTGMVYLRQSANRRVAVQANAAITNKIETVRTTVENGYSAAVLKAADVAAAKIVDKADEVAAKLAAIHTATYDGPDRRQPEKTP